MQTAMRPAELDALTALASGGVALELGAWYGASTIALARSARLVVSVDWHRGAPDQFAGDSLPTYLANIREWGNVIPVVGRFEDVLPLLRVQAFDLVFIDGTHTFRAARDDIELAAELVKPAGVIVAHDHGTCVGTTEAIALYGHKPITDTLVEVLA